MFHVSSFVRLSKLGILAAAFLAFTASFFFTALSFSCLHRYLHVDLTSRSFGKNGLRPTLKVQPSFLPHLIHFFFCPNRSLPTRFSCRWIWNRILRPRTARSTVRTETARMRRGPMEAAAKKKFSSKERILKGEPIRFSDNFSENA